LNCIKIYTCNYRQMPSITWILKLWLHDPSIYWLPPTYPPNIFITLSWKLMFTHILYYTFTYGVQSCDYACKVFSSSFCQGAEQKLDSNLWQHDPSLSWLPPTSAPDLFIALLQKLKFTYMYSYKEFYSFNYRVQCCGYACKFSFLRQFFQVAISNWIQPPEKLCCPNKEEEEDWISNTWILLTEPKVTLSTRYWNDWIPINITKGKM